MKRYFGIDLVKAIAAFFVISVHFFLNNGFYNADVKGIGMFISIIFRWIFYIAVPLFIIITGYLCKDKKLEKKYYKKIIPVLLTYLFISIICIIFRIFYLHEHKRILLWILSIFNFSADGYSWYVEMYIGLFLLIPFLNILYNGLETRKNKQIFIIILGILISLPSLINNIYVKEIKLEIIPEWWKSIYPLIYYFIGCYIKEYGIKINKFKGILLFIGLILFESIASYIYNYNSTFSWDFIQGYGSLQVVVITTIFFLLLYDIKCEGKIKTKIINKIASLSLDIYLFSFIVDKVVYGHLWKKFSTPMDYLPYMILIILIVFISSFVLSYIKDLIFRLITRIFKTKRID